MYLALILASKLNFSFFGFVWIVEFFGALVFMTLLILLSIFDKIGLFIFGSVLMGAETVFSLFFDGELSGSFFVMFLFFG